MAEANEYGLMIVESTSSVDMKTSAKTTLYTVPTGKTFYPMFVIVRETSASLAGGTDYDLGTGANANSWTTAVNMVEVTSSAIFKVIHPVTPTACAAATAFGIKPITGSTAACTATIDVIGYLS